MAIAGITTYALVNGVMIELTPEQVEALGCVATGEGAGRGGRSMSRDDDMRLNALDPRNIIARQRRVIEAVAKALGAYDEAGNIEGWVHDVEQFVLDCVPSIADMRPDVYVSASCPAPDDAPEGVTVGFDADGRFEIRRD